MEEFDLNMMAFLDGYEALPEPPANADAHAGVYAGAVRFQLQQQQQLQRKTNATNNSSNSSSPLDLHQQQQQQEQEIDDMAVLHETEQLLDSLEVSAFLDVTAQQQQQEPVPMALSSPGAEAIAVGQQQQQQQQLQVYAGTMSQCDADEQDENGNGTTGKRVGKTRNLSRERLKNELTYLRQKVSELEDELRILRPNSTLTGGSNAASLVALDRKKSILPVWQRIAERQLEGRSKAEAENARLKDMLEGQIKLAKGLEQMLRKRPNVALMNGDGSSTGKKPRLELDDDSVYEMLMEGIEPAYRNMDAVFRENGLYDTCDESIRHAHVKTRRDPSTAGGDEYLYVELADVFVIPFDLQVTSNAAWRSVSRQYLKASHAVYQNVKQPEDTIAVKFQVNSSRKGTDARLDVKLVMRRYIENERMVLVWRTMSKGENQLTGMYTDETGWCVLKKIPPAASATGPSAIGTVMQSCVHVVPKRSGSVIHENIPEIGVLTNVVVDAYEEDVIAINKAMENLLLEETLSIGTSGGSTVTSAGAERKARGGHAKSKSSK